MWKNLSDRFRLVVSTSRGEADRAMLRADISRLEEICDAVRYTPLPAVGGTAHVVEVVHLKVSHKAVGRTRSEAYRKMIDHLGSIESRSGKPGTFTCFHDR